MESKLTNDIQKQVDDCVQYCHDKQNHLLPHIAIRPALEAWAERYAALQTKCERYEKALKNITKPIAYLQRKAETEGGGLDGHYAQQLANSAPFLQSIANEALSAGEGQKQELPEPRNWNDYFQNQKEEQ